MSDKDLIESSSLSFLGHDQFFAEAPRRNLRRCGTAARRLTDLIATLPEFGHGQIQGTPSAGSAPTT
jgi:hypothetical protein